MTKQSFDPKIERAAILAEVAERHSSVMDPRGLERRDPSEHVVPAAVHLKEARAILGIVEPQAIPPSPTSELGPPPPMPPRPSER